MQQKNILVTGGAGFIGRALVSKLVASGLQIKVLDNCYRSSKEQLNNVLSEIELIIGDIRDQDIVDKAVSGVDMVIHLAAINGTENFYDKPYLVLDVGVRGMLNILESCKKHNVTDLIVASSSEVYQTPKNIPTDETAELIVPDVLNPRYSYGGSKLISELLTINFSRENLKRAIIFRPHNVYGAQMGWEHVIPQFVKRAVGLMQDYASNEKIPFNIQGDGNETRAFIYIDDFIDGLIKVIESGETQNIYHIGNPVEISIRELVACMFSILERDYELLTGPIMPGSTLRRCPDITKLRNLGFTPTVSLMDGLTKTVNWYMKELVSMDKKIERAL